MAWSVFLDGNSNRVNKLQVGTVQAVQHKPENMPIWVVDADGILLATNTDHGIVGEVFDQQIIKAWKKAHDRD